MYVHLSKAPALYPVVSYLITSRKISTEIGRVKSNPPIYSKPKHLIPHWSSQQSPNKYIVLLFGLSSINPHLIISLTPSKFVLNIHGLCATSPTLQSCTQTKGIVLNQILYLLLCCPCLLSSTVTLESLSVLI